ncbi:hypothetical protein AAFN85_05060 [Mucilaginibacter sp. CAU 1740]|uniref:hypothetical protein n=1 Tax=Mucilaginibacter sp. CAU 1740 TaxID=3140365 RepID=UPI00325A4B77
MWTTLRVAHILTRQTNNKYSFVMKKDNPAVASWRSPDKSSTIVNPFQDYRTAVNLLQDE